MFGREFKGSMEWLSECGSQWRCVAVFG